MKGAPFRPAVSVIGDTYYRDIHQYGLDDPETAA
jgi:hypothetical protein